MKVVVVVDLEHFGEDPDTDGVGLALVIVDDDLHPTHRGSRTRFNIAHQGRGTRFSDGSSYLPGMVRMEPAEPESDWMLRLSVDDGIATLTLDRPDKLNAWSWEASRQLGKRADEIRFDDDVRVIVVRAEGRAFCAGVDLGMPEDRVTGRSPAEKVRNYYEGIRWVHERFHAFSELPQPIVAAVHGYCLGFGFELALMCDIRIAAQDAVFALPEATVGVGVDAGGDLRLAREVGAGWAKLLALTGRRIDAQTAERLHIVQS